MTPEFVIVPFKKAPFTQPFRYKKCWWRKTSHLGGAGEMMRKFTSEIKGTNDEVYPASFTLLGDDELVAVEKTFLTLYDDYANLEE